MSCKYCFFSASLAFFIVPTEYVAGAYVLGYHFTIIAAIISLKGSEGLGYWGEQNCAGIFKQSMGVRNREGIGLSYRPAGIHRLAELIP
jgi:hypothetical protein